MHSSLHRYAHVWTAYPRTWICCNSYENFFLSGLLARLDNRLSYWQWDTRSTRTSANITQDDGMELSSALRRGAAVISPFLLSFVSGCFFTSDWSSEPYDWWAEEFLLDAVTSLFLIIVFFNVRNKTGIDEHTIYHARNNPWIRPGAAGNSGEERMLRQAHAEYYLYQTKNDGVSEY